MSRLRRAALVAIGGATCVLTAGLAVVILDWGTTEFIGIVTVLLVIGLAFDGRHRTSTIVRRISGIVAMTDRQIVELEHLRRELDSERRATERSICDLRASLDVAEARLTETIESSRTTVAAALGRSEQRLTKSIPPLHGIQTIVGRESGRLYQQVESLLRLEAGVEVTGMAPPMRGWAASPDVVALLVTELWQLRPTCVVECGSGASTVWLAMAVRTAGLRTRVVALEHDEAFGAATQRALDDCRVADVAEIRVASLCPLAIDGGSYQWYDPASLDGIHDVGLVFVDGPPGETGPNARLPALPMLYPLLSVDATIVLDDTIRAEEAAIASAWSARFPDFAGVGVNLEKGAWVMRRRSGAQ